MMELVSSKQVGAPGAPAGFVWVACPRIQAAQWFYADFWGTGSVSRKAAANGKPITALAKALGLRLPTLSTCAPAVAGDKRSLKEQNELWTTGAKRMVTALRTIKRHGGYVTTAATGNRIDGKDNPAASCSGKQKLVLQGLKQHTEKEKAAFEANEARSGFARPPAPFKFCAPKLSAAKSVKAKAAVRSKVVRNAVMSQHSALVQRKLGALKSSDFFKAVSVASKPGGASKAGVSKAGAKAGVGASIGGAASRSGAGGACGAAPAKAPPAKARAQSTSSSSKYY